MPYTFKHLGILNIQFEAATTNTETKCPKVAIECKWNVILLFLPSYNEKHKLVEVQFNNMNSREIF
jgi:hypothetical protein